jgi:hypothetical protein
MTNAPNFIKPLLGKIYVSGEWKHTVHSMPPCSYLDAKFIVLMAIFILWMSLK